MAPNGKEKTKAPGSSTLVAASAGSMDTDDKFAPSMWGDFFINYDPSAVMQACRYAILITKCTQIYYIYNLVKFNSFASLFNLFVVYGYVEI